MSLRRQLYHLRDARRSLLEMTQLGTVIVLETEVVDSLDPTLACSLKEQGADQSLNELGTRPSVGMVEGVFRERGLSFLCACFS